MDREACHSLFWEVPGVANTIDRVVIKLREAAIFFCYSAGRSKEEEYDGKKKSECLYDGLCRLRLLHEGLSAQCDHNSKRYLRCGR